MQAGEAGGEEPMPCLPCLPHLNVRLSVAKDSRRQIMI